MKKQNGSWQKGKEESSPCSTSETSLCNTSAWCHLIPQKFSFRFSMKTGFTLVRMVTNGIIWSLLQFLWGFPLRGAAAWYSGCMAVGASLPQLASPFFPYCWFILLSYFFSLASSRHGQSAVKHWFSLWRLSMSPVLLQTVHAHFACFANEQKVFQLLNRLLKMYFWSLFLFYYYYFLRSKLFLNLVQTLFLLSKYWYNIW